nr:hypothetical protein [Sphingomonas arenae]
MSNQAAEELQHREIVGPHGGAEPGQAGEHQRDHRCRRGRESPPLPCGYQSKGQQEPELRLDRDQADADTREHGAGGEAKSRREEEGCHYYPGLTGEQVGADERQG